MALQAQRVLPKQARIFGFNLGFLSRYYVIIHSEYVVSDKLEGLGSPLS